MKDCRDSGLGGPVLLCRLDDLPDPGCRGFAPAEAGGRAEIFLVRQGGAVFGYRNWCPHAGTTLDWVPGRFLARDGKQILCGTHGALFRIDDGICTAGPCVGERLEPVELHVVGGDVLLA